MPDPCAPVPDIRPSAPARDIRQCAPARDVRLMLGQQLLNGVVVGSVYALFALGFTLIFGIHRILNLAHGAVFMWGALVGLYVVTELKLPFAVALLAAALAGGLITVLLDWLAFRPLRKAHAPEFSAIVSSIGAGLVLVSLGQRVSGTQVRRFPFGSFPIEIFSVAGLRVSLLQITIIGSVAVLVVALVAFMRLTSFGRQVRAVAVNEQTAALLGINPTLIYFQTFFVSGALAGISGVLIGLAFNSVHFLMGDPYMLRAFVVIVLGGLGSIAGAVCAALLLGLVQTLTIAYLTSGLSDAILFSLLFLTLLVRPTGFFGQLRTERRIGRA